MLPNWLYGKSKSKLASILGGGGTPADYNQVKAQVTQNTEDIEELTNELSVKTDSTTISGLTLVKYGRVVEVLINGTYEITAGQNNNIGTLPNAYIPSDTVYAWVATNAASPKFTQVRFNNPSGTVEINGWMIDGSVTLQGSFTFISKS